MHFEFANVNRKIVVLIADSSQTNLILRKSEGTGQRSTQKMLGTSVMTEAGVPFILDDLRSG